MNFEAVVLFDGECVLCNGLFQWIVKHDKRRRFGFATLQSIAGKSIHNALPDSILLMHKGKMWVKSRAVFRILSILGFPWSMALIFRILPPRFTDWLYTIIARNRYSWFGKKNACMVPTPELQDRFVGEEAIWKRLKS